MLFKVLKHPKTQDPQRPMEPEIYVVEEAELLHFLHENAKPGTNATGHDRKGSYCKVSASRG